ncbi:MAG: hypothetical protein IJW20_00030 [Clostridia bacterium]|nr:hypothetical protein [Clostridia bacterium]
MKNVVKIILAIVIVVAIVAGVVLFLNNSKPKSNLPEITQAEDLIAIVNKVYEGNTENLPMLDTQVLDFVNTPETAQYATDIEDFSNIEYAVASMPMMNAQAYSLTILKVKDGANVEEVAKMVNEKAQLNRWVCVCADKVLTTSSGNVVFSIMSNAEIAQTIYDSFKALAGGIGEEYVREFEQPEMPEDMMPEDTTPAATEE